MPRETSSEFIVGIFGVSKGVPEITFKVEDLSITTTSYLPT